MRARALYEEGESVYNRDKRIRTDESGKVWICCPKCGKKFMPVRPGTRLIEFPLLCRQCKQESVIDYDGVSLSLRA